MPRFFGFLFFLLLVLCGGVIAAHFYGLDKLLPGTLTGKPAPRIHTLILPDFTHKTGGISFTKDIKPILDNRCVACHAGADAPCQLQLNAYEGIRRGLSKEPVYNQYRINAIEPSRLFSPQDSLDDWRKNGFFAVLNEHSQFPEINLNHSVLALSLNLKRINPLPSDNTKLPEGIPLLANDHLECANLDEFKSFQKNHPLWGMPYGLPQLSDDQQARLMNWIQDGAKDDTKTTPLPADSDEIKKWEAFFNAPSSKQKLTARYLYEHLYSGKLHFKGQPDHQFYQWVRSTTPSPQAIEEIASPRPFDVPTTATFYYRLKPVTTAITDKDHFVYELSDDKMARLDGLFLKPDYNVTQLPGYDPESAANPFKTFAELPATARYQFLLDDAQFFFSAFLKGPVSMGNGALTVIRDHFWIAFSKPQSEFDAPIRQFLADNDQLLRLPASKGESIGFAEWQKLGDLQQQYLHNKDVFVTNTLLNQQPVDINFIWNGERHNSNALLTVFRHHNNASVAQGLLGKPPLTAWIIDYPLFERIHYLMVAGFNIYGSAAHQATTRLYMDLLRVEAENNFLKFVPAQTRNAVYGSWYQGIDFKIFSGFHAPTFSTDKDPAIPYQTTDITHELFDKINQQLDSAKQSTDWVNRCTPATCPPVENPTPQQQTDSLIRQLADLHGEALNALPEMSLLRITQTDGQKDSVYTLIRNKKLLNVSFVFAEKLQRQPAQDTLTVIPGFMGSYPNQFWVVPEAKLRDFINQLSQTQNNPDATQRFYGQYAIRRSHPEFWQHYDWFNQRYRQLQALNAGLLDLNFYENL